MVSASLIFKTLQPCDVIVGSAPESLELADLDLSKFTTVAINNAWRIHKDFDYSIYPGDFPEDKRAPQNNPIKHVPSALYYRHVYKAGGLLFSGATMGICAGYFAIGALRNPLISFWGCNMDYSTGPDAGKTHFYGQGRADPLLKQPATYASIKNLKAKSYRLFLWGLMNNKLLVNLNPSPNANLVLPKYSQKIEVDRVIADRSFRSLLSKAMDVFNAEKDFPVSRYSLNLVPISQDPELMAKIDKIDVAWTEIGEAAQEHVQRLIDG